MADLSKLIRKRGSIKASLTAFQKHLDSAESEDVLDELQITIFNNRSQGASDLLGEFQSIHNEIECICEEEDLEFHREELQNFEDRFYTITSRAKLLLKKYDDTSSSITVSSSPKCESGVIKLPEITLPKFNGDFENWLEFRDIFTTVIHANGALNDIQKFFYLRGALEGAAAASIKKIQYTESNYTVAWDMLCERFNNKKRLLHDHLGALLFFDPLQKGTFDKLQQLADNISRHLGSIQQLGQSIDNWDCLLIFWISQRLDNATLCDWERQQRNNTASPNIDTFLNFIRDRANFIDSLDYKCNHDNKSTSKPNKGGFHNTKKETSRALLSNNYSCFYCKGEHAIYSCEGFLGLSSQDRNKFVKSNNSMCINCLRLGHSFSKCKLGPCKKCKKGHNTLLHTDADNSIATNEDSGATVLSSGVLNNRAGLTILSTALLLVCDNFGSYHEIRALLDCGSQTSFITERVQRKLGITARSSNISIYGITNSVSTIKSKCDVQIRSKYNSFSASIICYVLPEITSVFPNLSVGDFKIQCPAHVKLADPEFYKAGPIDMLIGADLFWQILGNNKFEIGKNAYLHETSLGWIVSGQFVAFNSKSISCNLSLNQELLQTLTKFWEIEELENSKVVSSPDERLCEETFTETTTRDESGRFVVNMPLKQAPGVLGESRVQAERRFLALERRLLKNTNFYSMYRDFMSEYVSLNPMSLIGDDLNHVTHYYMPHHGILKESSLTTKLRVVFDASAPSSNGLSLNNIQAVGPILQNDLLSIILRFRQYKYVVSADIAKMYRQVLINPSQRPLQLILWRNSISDPIRTYALNTVTYGQASASFLAIRCLFELAKKIESQNPLVSRIVRQDFYVDDLLTGANTIQEAKHICLEVSNVLQSGCFQLRKWCSNVPEVLGDLNASNIAHETIDFSIDDTIKTLGLLWSCKNDNLFYNVNVNQDNNNLTKRSILSLISRIFDPLGLLSPCTVLAKILLQELWSSKVSWDDPIPDKMRETGVGFVRDLHLLNNLIIPRHVVLGDSSRIELHGFCDSSQRAYGCCVFLRSVSEAGEVRVSLLAAKSKVAPIKTISIPRLELCAALLLARLSHKIINSMSLDFSHCCLWSDSTITLAWIKTCPNLLKTFTANRVSEIQTLTSNCQWKYVPTSQNPADIVSRGMAPSQLIVSKLWWSGPDWLIHDQMEWLDAQSVIDELPEMKTSSCLSQRSDITLHFPFENFSNVSRMKRVLAYMFRFKENCIKSRSDRVSGALTLDELSHSMNALVRICQHQSFCSEIQLVLSNKPSRLSSLAPFLDNNNILRVGGRLKYSDYDFNKNHPILLSGRHHFTKLLFQEEHVRLLHAGPQHLLNSIRNTYWPISGRNLARATVRKCLKCFRFNITSAQPIMGDLPKSRVTPSSPFSVVGIDYAGPFLVKDRKGRGCKITKCYMGLFVCFSTRAVHLELVSSLSTESFLQALRRFISRRGRPARIFSDNGSNFVGAQREISKFLNSKQLTDNVMNFASSESINWQFIPPYSPHFGGLWEAGVKSSKHHLKRVVSKTPLTFEEFYTLLVQIEGILNSRPLSPLSSDPNDLNPLCPAHFLIGRPITALNEGDLTDIKVNRLDRFQLVQQMCQHFWRRWMNEYISELQTRVRWRTTQAQISKDALVLIKEDSSCPTQWRLGRILQVHPGPDGVNRVATIKTSAGLLKRGFQKICPLPITD